MKDVMLEDAKKKVSAAKARTETLEVQLKDIKQMYQSKIAILIEKTENDDRLIMMLKDEIKRIESVKGVKGTLQTGHKIELKPADDELIKLRGENGRLRNQVKCFEIEVSQKKEKIEKLLRDQIGTPDDNMFEKDVLVRQLQEEISRLRVDISKQINQ